MDKFFKSKPQVDQNEILLSLKDAKKREVLFKKIAKGQVNYREIVLNEHHLGVKYYDKPARARSQEELQIWRAFNQAKSETAECRWEQEFDM